jgi:hypothetical protein
MTDGVAQRGERNVRFINESGKTYGQYYVIEPVTVEGVIDAHARFRCLCSCGTETIVTGQSLRAKTSTRCNACRNADYAKRIAACNRGRRAQCLALRIAKTARTK